ncbi:hypothetical protein EFN10_11890, partial [Propionibacterium freudenreichii]
AEVAAAPGPAPKGTRGRASKAGKPATRTSGAKKSGARASATGRGTATKKAVTTKKKTQRKAA